MTELEMQQLLIDAAKSVGGQGLKCNNRFLVGVVDLLISISGHRPMWLEAKRIDLSGRTISNTNHNWRLEVTKKQQDHLRDWQAAGMLTGVASFMQEKGKGVRGLQLCIYSYETCVVNEWIACVIDHHEIGDHRNRMQTLADMMMEFSK